MPVTYQAEPGAVLQPRIKEISTNVSTSDTTIEPRQPRRLEKKKNMSVVPGIVRLPKEQSRRRKEGVEPAGFRQHGISKAPFSA